MQLTQYLFIDRVITEHPRASTQWKAGKKKENAGGAEENRGKHGKQEKTIEKIKRKIYIGVIVWRLT